MFRFNLIYKLRTIKINIIEIVVFINIRLDIRMTKYLNSRDPLKWVNHQQPTHQVLKLMIRLNPIIITNIIFSRQYSLE